MALGHMHCYLRRSVIPKVCSWKRNEILPSFCQYFVKLDQSTPWKNNFISLLLYSDLYCEKKKTHLLRLKQLL